MLIRLSHTVFVGMFVSVALTKSISAAFHSSSSFSLSTKTNFIRSNHHVVRRHNLSRYTQITAASSSYCTKNAFIPTKKNGIQNSNNSHHWNTMTKCQMSTTTATEDTITNNELKGMEWIKRHIVEVLNESFDYKEVARNVAIAKLEPKPKKKKKKKKAPVEGTEAAAKAEEVNKNDDGPPPLTQEQKDAIVNEAVENAVPFGLDDVMVTPATKLEFGDYQCNAAMSLAKNVGMAPRLVLYDALLVY